MENPRDRLIVALDLPSVEAAEAVVERLGDTVTFYKIGYQLAFAGGLALAEKLIWKGRQVFVDLKLHDIGHTVEKGVESVARMGATFLTVHGYPQTMKAAVDGRGDSNLRILAVTVLTSYDDADLAAAGYDFTVSELVAERARSPVTPKMTRPQGPAIRCRRLSCSSRSGLRPLAIRAGLMRPHRPRPRGPRAPGRARRTGR